MRYSQAQKIQDMDPSPQQAFLARVRELLVPHTLSVQAREALLMEAFYTSHGWILGEILFDGTPNDFVDRCLVTLLAQDPRLLEILLIKLRPRYGEAQQALISELIAELPHLPPVAPGPTLPAKTQHPATAAAGRPTLFVSYAPEDSDQAQWLAERLAHYGHACRLERHPEKGSDAWLAATAGGLSNAYAVLLLAGAETWQDRWVQVELLAALDKRKQIVPVRLPHGRLPGFLPADVVPIAFAAADETGLQAVLRRLPQPPPAAPRTPWAPLSPDLLRRADELIYMDRLKLAELRHVAQYTRLGGEAQLRRTRSDRLVVPSVVARQELRHTRWRRGGEAPAEARRFEDAVPELHQIRRAVLLGEPGAGKTTTLYKLATDLIDSALLDRTAPVPLMVRLGLWTDAGESFGAFLRRSVGDLGDGLAERLRAGRAALLLDGLNEIPAGQQAQKYGQVAEFLKRKEYRQLMAIVTCREQDYPPERALALDRITVEPLDPLRVRDFIHNYLDREEGAAAGEDLFWQLAGADAEATYQWFVEDIGQKLKKPFQTFWLADELPENIGWWKWRDWLRQRAHPARLLRLAANPYLLFMLIDVYRAAGRRLPANRGELFDAFVETLLVRERLFGLDRQTETVIRLSAGEALLDSLTALAYAMQRRRAQEDTDGSAQTALPLATVARFLDAQQRKQAASASLLTLGEEVRFAHQLLQEYFVARAMRQRIFAPEGIEPALKAADIWQPEKWWEPTNWEEATILLAGLYSDDCSKVVNWVGSANPEAAARCIAESGAYTPDETKRALRDRWLPRLTDLQGDPDARARAAVGRALGLVTLADGTPLDNRPGVGVIEQNGVHIPDMAWGEPVPAGEYVVGRDPKAYESLNKQVITIEHAYRLARFPVTYAQFHCFVAASDFADPRWWVGMPAEEEAYGRTYRLRELSEQAFQFGNHPRERVSWSQAIAFCRWLSDKLGYGVDLPTEYEWEVAARYPDGRLFPWGDQFDAARANTKEGDNIGRTSAVGIYPHGANQQLGLYDLSGNVWEWCRTKYEDPEDGRVDASGARRVVRGGSWDDYRGSARAACRIRRNPGGRHDHLGFRVVCRPPSR